MIFLKKQKGSALIIALLIMGVLMTLALGLSDLVIREVRITSDIVKAGKAFYSAESGIESALLDLQQNLPGYEVPVDKQRGADKGEVYLKGGNKYDIGEDEFSFSYSIENRTHTVPLIDTDIVSPAVANDSPRMLYNRLALNETISIPLFTVDENGLTQNVQNFRVEYFIDAEIDPEWQGNFSFNNIDMLRWKIAGLKTEGIDPSVTAGSGRKIFTESIGDYIAVFPGSNENNPTCFGTENSNVSKTFDGIYYPAHCNGDIYDYAREAYTYNIVRNSRGEQEVQTLTHSEKEGTQMTITTFLGTHTHNYLTISNIFNPSVLKGVSDFEKRNKAQIYYRIIIPEDDQYTIREFAKITSTGFIGSIRQQIEAYIRPDRFMPVFNFSLYRTEVED
jgi:hypothetical protein